MVVVRKICARVLYTLLKKSYDLNVFADGKLKDLESQSGKAKAEIEEQSKAMGCFMADPTDLAKAVLDKKYSDLVKIYFMLKQALAIFESESQEFSIQIFNEMRNAFDHLMRSQIPHANDKDNESKQIKKSEDHVQRAFLDISKILCVLYRDMILKRASAYPEEVISHVDNGQYQKKFTELEVQAKSRFALAKASDYRINDIDSEKVREFYIKAIIAHKILHDYQVKNMHKFKWAKYKVNSVKGIKLLPALLVSLFAGLLLSKNEQGEFVITQASKLFEAASSLFTSLF